MSNAHANQWMHTVQAAFPDRQLCQRIFSAASADPLQLPRLFDEISQYVLSLRAQPPAQDAQTHSKKRKLEEGVANGSSSHFPSRTIPTQSLKLFFECKDVSVQAPARKKMKIELAGDGASPQAEQLRLFNANTNEVEYGLDAADVDQVFCLPMPEKQARQMNIILFPRTGTLDLLGRPAEQVLFVLNETAPAEGSIQGQSVAEDDTYVTVMDRALSSWLRPRGKSIIKPRADEFASSIPQSHRKGEKAYHVRAHRGSKEGYLFFLENGIVFGFKKPLAFFPFSSIDSISYTSVLQRTFNLVVAAMEGEGEASETKEVEFSMLDQEDFAGIDAYVKRHGLNDASMAAQRRAKAYNVNKEKKGETNGDAAAGSGTGQDGGDDDGGQSELQKAEQQLQDEEDELEEDYEVSGGESEGEGEDSEEDEEEEDEDEVEEVDGDGDGEEEEEDET